MDKEERISGGFSHFFLGETIGPDPSQEGPDKLPLHTPVTSLQCELEGHRGQSVKSGGPWPPAEPPLERINKVGIG